MRSRIDEFALWWPAAAARLEAVLRARGVAADDIQDVIQATAERALVGAPFSSPQHLTGWTVVVGRNLAIDRFRRSRWELPGIVPESITSDDLADVVAAMEARDALMESIERLPAGKRAVLAETVQPRSRKESVQMAVERHRVRKRLREVFEGFAAALVFRFKRLASGLGIQPDQLAGLAAAATAAAACAIVLGVGLQTQHSEPLQREAYRATVPTILGSLTPTLAAAQAPAPAPSQSGLQQRVSVGLGRDADGNERRLDVGPQHPSETGALVCVGEPGEPGHDCVFWPDPIIRIVAVASERTGLDP